MIKKYSNSGFFFFLILFLVSCSAADDDDEFVCTDIAVPAIAVDVDLTTQLEEPLDEIWVFARDGFFVDSVNVAQSPDLIGELAYERIGVYTVEVIASGYQDWMQENIRVQRDAEECHVETVNLNPQLVLGE